MVSVTVRFLAVRVLNGIGSAGLCVVEGLSDATVSSDCCSIKSSEVFVDEDKESADRRSRSGAENRDAFSSLSLRTEAGTVALVGVS